MSFAYLVSSLVMLVDIVTSSHQQFCTPVLRRWELRTSYLARQGGAVQVGVSRRAPRVKGAAHAHTAVWSSVQRATRKTEIIHIQNPNFMSNFVISAPVSLYVTSDREIRALHSASSRKYTDRNQNPRFCS